MGCDDPLVGLDGILRLIRERRGLDFTAYRRATIERRVLGRMRALFTEDCAEYLRLLERDDAEVGRLVEQITIKVSAFFRDPEVFSLLESVVLPSLAAGIEDRPIRVWVAGCANGEEPYSLAMLLSEADPCGARPRPEILATDIDAKALDAARAGSYVEDALVSLDAERRQRYFRREGEGVRSRYVLGDRLRERVQFAFHDLGSGQAPPGCPPFDLVCCRNVFIYFGGDLREHTQRLVCGQVAPGGYLCLGTSEWLVPAVQSAFQVTHRRARVFQRTKPGGEGRCRYES